jgi:hypothetical protein
VPPIHRICIGGSPDSRGRDPAAEPSLLNFRRNLYREELPLVMDTFRIDALSTKIGLSSGAVTVSSSLRDELPEFRSTMVENDRQPLDSRRRCRILSHGENNYTGNALLSGLQWYSTSGADSGGGLVPNFTALKPCFS